MPETLIYLPPFPKKEKKGIVKEENNQFPILIVSIIPAFVKTILIFFILFFYLPFSIILWYNLFNQY